METKADEQWAKFLAFNQHVQYWKMKKQAFVSDYQSMQSISFMQTLVKLLTGGNTLLSKPQISLAGY